MSTSEIHQYNYDLPETLIAKHPCEQRTQSRLLHLDRANKSLSHHHFADLTQFCKPNDLIVLNNTQVIKARLSGHKQTGGQLEVFIERVLSNTQAKAMIKASNAPQIGSTIILADQFKVVITSKYDEFYQLSLVSSKTTDISWWAIMATYGEVPLPPYLNRDAAIADITRYQSVFASQPGAVAAPTASLHFDEPLIDTLNSNGVDIGFLTLHVGAGTFLPLRAEQIKTKQLHQEWFEISRELLDKIEHCKSSKGRVIAVGTTVVRALESAFLKTKDLRSGQHETRLFIQPGFEFAVTDVMITNFHLPKSSLLMLVASFAGLKFTREAYQTAVKEKYRFFSYGDAMIIT